MIKSSTFYSASNELRYVDPEYFALQNKETAKYYGARRIYGIDGSDEKQVDSGKSKKIVFYCRLGKYCKAVGSACSDRGIITMKLLLRRK